MENKSKFYKKWWFWACIVIIMLAVLTIVILKVTNYSNNAIETSSSSKENKGTTTTEYYNNNVKLKENPYQVVDKYDGVYKFSLSSTDNIGNTYKGEGYISFNNGICRLKGSLNSQNVEYKGFCGLNQDDNEEFYFTINYDKGWRLISYNCKEETENNLLCNLKSYTDLVDGYNKELKLAFMSKEKDIELAILEEQNKEKIRKEEEEKARKEQEKKDFKASCKTYTFEQMARNPDKFKGNNVKVTGEVIQALYDSKSVDLRINITKEGKYITHYKDTIYVVYYPQEGEDKILENDIVTVYGTAQGDYSYTSAIGSKITLPLIKGEYIEIQ